MTEKDKLGFVPWIYQDCRYTFRFCIDSLPALSKELEQSNIFTVVESRYCVGDCYQCATKEFAVNKYFTKTLQKGFQIKVSNSERRRIIRYFGLAKLKQQ